jgi:hypothetical protein
MNWNEKSSDISEIWGSGTSSRFLWLGSASLVICKRKRESKNNVTERYRRWWGWLFHVKWREIGED